MKIKKNSFIFVGLFVSFVLLAFSFALENSSAAPVISGRPAACEEGTTCTPGDTCCWTAAGGDTVVTCPNGGTWPDSDSEAACVTGRSCSQQGIGGKCQRDVVELEDIIQQMVASRFFR